MSGLALFRREWTGAEGLPAPTDIRASLTGGGGPCPERQDMGIPTRESRGSAKFRMTVSPASPCSATAAALRDGFNRPGPLTRAGLSALAQARGIDTDPGFWT